MNISNIIKKIFSRKKTYKLQQVFTPTSYAVLAYKRRPLLENRLKSAILQPGKQIIIYGHSGCGKSTLLHNVLKDNSILNITSQCVNNTTIENLILDAFDRLNYFYVSSLSDNIKVSNSANLKSEYGIISSSIQSTTEFGHSIEQKRALPPQLTPQRLASFIGAANNIWIIEDFHKVCSEEKIKLAQIMKLFVDAANEFPSLKIVTIGAAETGYQVLECDSELNNRVTEIGVPLMTPPEIMDILNTGTKLLNVNFDNELKDSIVKYSNCLATITHQLAYNICEFNKVNKTQSTKLNFKASVLSKSLESFLLDKEDTFNQLYNKITEQRSGKYHNVELILRAMVELSGNEISQRDIMAKISHIELDYPQGNLSTYLKKLCSPECDEVLRLNSGRYTFSNPFFKAYLKMKFGLSKDIIVEY